jgi:hypothetical protein
MRLFFFKNRGKRSRRHFIKLKEKKWLHVTEDQHPPTRTPPNGGEDQGRYILLRHVHY